VLARGEVTDPFSPSSSSSPPFSSPSPSGCAPIPARAPALASLPMPRPLCPPSVVCHPGPHLRRDSGTNEEEGRVAVEGEIRHAGRRRLPRANPPPPLPSSSLSSSSSSPLLIGNMARAGPQPSGSPLAGRASSTARAAGRALSSAAR
jgi:hypothetical protein